MKIEEINYSIQTNTETSFNYNHWNDKNHERKKANHHPKEFT